ncbi:MAG TPA: hypothetical protein VFV75_16575 [Candidatus Polarisedimenticolaceae bacterium]|nr:hypothetical protein [Candidatus Polarisedimenticolaceae bacterium]
MLRTAPFLALAALLTLPAWGTCPDDAPSVQSSAARLAAIRQMVAGGRVPAQPRWQSGPPRTTDGVPMCDLKRPFRERTARLQSSVSLFAPSVPRPDLWLPVQERALLTAGCPCDPASSPGRLEDAPLRLSKVVASSSVMLTWTSSCSPGAEDYAVYQGSVGSFASHTAATCSTSGSTAWTLTPGSGNRYFLVVPLSATEEGSYGNRSDGSERPAAAGPCRASQRISACP